MACGWCAHFKGETPYWHSCSPEMGGLCCLTPDRKPVKIGHGCGSFVWNSSDRDDLLNFAKTAQNYRRWFKEELVKRKKAEAKAAKHWQKIVKLRAGK